MGKEKIGWIGLGHMGIPMASNLIKAGFDVSVYNRSTEKLNLLTKLGAKKASSAGELCNVCDIVFLMVSDAFQQALQEQLGDEDVMSVIKVLKK